MSALRCAGYYHCNSQVAVGKPRDKDELRSILQQYPRAKASGIGHRCADMAVCQVYLVA